MLRNHTTVLMYKISIPRYTIDDGTWESAICVADYVELPSQRGFDRSTLSSIQEIFFKSEHTKSMHRLLHRR